MSTFVIEEVLSQEEFSTEHGVFRAYEVRFSGDTAKGIATHKRKASSPPPTPGETIDAEIIRKGERTELKRVWQPNRPGASSGGRSPQDTRQIVRQHSQKVAMQYITAKAYLKRIEDFTVEDVCKIAAAFQADAESVS